MTKPHLDPGTGEVKLNGKLGAVLAWMKFASQWLTLPLLVLIIGWGLTHRDQHQDFSSFMSEGARVTPGILEDRLHRHQLQTLEIVSDRFPPDDLVTEVANNTAAIRQLEQRQAGTETALKFLTSEVQAVKMILQSRGN